MRRKLSIFIFSLVLIVTSVTAQKSQNPNQTNNSIAKVADTGCTGKDTFDQGVKIVPNANSWTDSYQANDFCFCKSSFDHGVGNFKININGKGRNIKDICNELKKHPKFRNIKNGDPRYNTIQCGNDPGHGDAITIKGKRIKDEKVCPGRVDQGSKGCKCKGPKFDMAWLSSRPRFDGGGNPPNPPTGGGGNGNVTFKGQSNNKYLSTNMIFNSGSAGNQQKFTVQSAGNGTVSIKASNGKYISSENGNKPMTANRSAVGAWEKFTLVSQGGDIYAIKGNNGKYVSHENGNRAATCNRGGIQAWEKFVIKGLPNKTNSLQIDSNTKQSISLYPNPVVADDLSLQIDVPADVHGSIEIISLNGKSIQKKNLGMLKKGSTSILLNELRNSINVRGLYLFNVKLGEKSIVKQIMIE